MPTRTIPRRTTAPAHRAGRFSRPLPTQRPAPKPRRGRRSPQQSGLMATATRLLPMAGAGKKRKGGSSKAGPAMGLLVAGAGALLGRHQMRKRRAQDTIEHPTPSV